ncbi:hypothetical protein [Synechococcus elongatus]|nr:hypothetical protein [Synechococcus elongatus]MBD2587472.1 hypothetical protein [Synechococcus elongatus FACHB-242]MBD2688749.1 hypothetical protein [Synechococcus elongatus FACHB-1061]MBD2707820.1 hypothetical protein [Synechococcus elongatus PCC 7942 = FACHB-805]WKW06620.1 hypothetical protein QY054_05430 [Synechococcus elongatus PCC 7942 = FACHB-805]
MQPPDRLRDRCWTMVLTSLALIAISTWSWQKRPQPENRISSPTFEQAR